MCSYNGYEFTAYSTQDGLSNNTCLNIRVGPEGELWFLGLDGTLSHQTSFGLQPFSGNSEISKLIGRDRLPVGIAWGTNGEMAAWFWGNAAIYVIVYTPQTQQFRMESLHHLSSTPLFFEVPKSKFYNFYGSLITDSRLNGLVYRENRDVFASYQKTPQVLDRYILTVADSTQSLNFKSSLNDLYFDKKGNLWVSTNGGIYRFPDGDLSQKPGAFFEDVAVSSVMEDRDGNYWVTTLERGVYLVPSFDILNLDFADTKEASNKVTAVSSLENHLVFSTLNGRIYAVNRRLEVTLLAHSRWDFGQYTFASQTEGLVVLGRYRVKEKDGQCQILQNPGYMHDAVVAQLSNHDIFHGGARGYHVTTQEGLQLVTNQGFGRVQCCLEVNDRLWLGTLDGLWSIENYNYRNPLPTLPNEPLLKTRINQVLEDGFGNLWIATIGNGLLHLRGEKVQQLGKEEGFNREMVNKMAFEKPGVLWVATNKGLSRIVYDCKDSLIVQKVDNFNSQDGLPDNFIVDVEVWNKKVWVATVEGLAYFSVKTLDYSEGVPIVSLILESVQVNKVDIDPQKPVTLDHKHNDLAFRFLGAAFRKPMEVPFYRYALVKGDDISNPETEISWTYTDERTVNYLNLPPEQYHFMVSASNRAGKWSPSKNFSFIIEPHFTQTLVFQVLVGMLAILLMLGIFFYFSWRNRQRQIQKRRLQEARLKAQEAEISILRSQMNPHFVFNALNSIQNFIFKKDVLKANHFLSRFARLMRDGLRFSRKPLITLAEEVGFLRSYLELEAMRFPDRFGFELEIDSRLDPNQVCIPPFLFQPLLENAVKHAFKEINYKGLLTIRFEMAEPGWLSVQVQDNGGGFSIASLDNNAKNQSSLGLRIVRDRIDLLKSEKEYAAAAFDLINLETRGGQGILATFRIPLQFCEKNESDHH